MDPRKRLELAQASAPSLRLAAAPTQTAEITNVNAPVGGAQLSNAPVQVASPQYLQNQGEGPSQAIGPVDTSYASGPQQKPQSSLSEKLKNVSLAIARGIISPAQYFANVAILDPTRQLAAQVTGNKVAQANAERRANENLGLGADGQDFTAGAKKFAGNSVQALALPFAATSGVAKNVALGVAGGAGSGLAEDNSTLKDVVTGGLVGGALGGVVSGASAVIKNLSTKTQIPEETLRAVVQNGDEKAIKALAQEAGMDDTEFRALFKPGANEAVKQGGTAGKAVQGAYLNTGSKDSLDLAVTALGQTENKGAVRDIVTKLLPDIKGNDLNRLVNDIVKTKDPQDVAEKLVAARQSSTAATSVEAPQSTALSTAEPVVPNETRVAQGTAPVVTPAETARVATEAPQAPATPVVAPNPGEHLANAAPQVQQAAQDITAQLKDATANYEQIAKTRAQAKAQRIAVGGKVYADAGGGTSGLKAKLGVLKGSYESGELPPINVSDATKQSLLDHIENDPNLREFEKLNTQLALAKLTGDISGHLTPGEIKYLGKAFGPDFAETAQAAVDATATKFSKIKDAVGQVAGLPRALLSTFDFSFGGRQGAALGSRFPKEWVAANRDSIRYAVDKGFYKQSMDAMEHSDVYTTITDKMKIALPAIQKDLKNEGFASADLAEKIPIAGRAIQGSDRAYNGGLTKLRFDTAKKIIDSYGGTDAFLKFFGGNDKALKDLGEVINTFSGRGGQPGGFVSRYGKVLSSALFSPRLWASRLNMLNPQFYYRLEPAAQKLALQSAASFATTAGTILAIASAAGADVVWDPRSADFAKIKMGNTRYDILGGLQQNIRLAAQLITGEKINSTTGKLQTLGPDRGFGKPSRKDILYQAFENKENPLVAFATHMLEGTDPSGKAYNPLQEAGKLVVPLNLQSISDSTGDQKSLLKGAVQNIPGVFGVGVQTYGAAKNAPTTDTTKAIQATKDDTAKKTADFTSGLSKDEQALIKESDTSLKDMVKNGKLDQATADSIVGLKKAKDNLTKGVTTPDGLKSNDAIDFYKKYDSLTPEGQKRYLAASPDQAAKNIADTLNKTKPKGVPDLVPSNQLAKLYADYEKDVNTHGDYTVIDKNNKAKAFFATATKQVYAPTVQDAYNEGSSATLKALITDGKLSNDDISRAVALDNQLYSAGLTSSLKFSKAFRKAGGFGIPDAFGAAAGSGNATTAKTAPVVNQHLAALLPSTGATAQAAPNMANFKKTNIAPPVLPQALAPQRLVPKTKRRIKIKL